MIDDENLKLKHTYLEYYRTLPVQKLAGEYIGKSENTIIRWKDADDDFANQMSHAKAEWAKAREGKVKSEEWLLERVLKDHFSQRSELTGKDGKDLPAPIFGGLSKDDLPEGNSDR